MEIFFKKYFWTFTVAILIVIGLILGAAASNFIASRLTRFPPEPIVLPQPTSPSGEAHQERKGTSISDRNIFDSEARRAAEADQFPGADGKGGMMGDGEEYEEELDDTIVDSTLNVTLRITLVSEQPEWSIAVLDNGQETYVVRPGSSVEDEAVVHSIAREQVVVRRAGRLEMISFRDGDGPPTGAPARSPATVSRRPAPRPAPKAAAKSDNPVAEGIKQTAEGKYQIDRRMLDEQLKDLNQLGSQARIVPHYQDGKPAGFKLVGVRPDSIYSHIGIRSGDVIRMINGEAIDSPNKALELYQRLQSANDITVDLERRGQRQSLNYSIR